MPIEALPPKQIDLDVPALGVGNGFMVTVVLPEEVDVHPLTVTVQ